MSRFRNKLNSSRPGRILRDVRSRISASEKQKGKRRSRTPSPSREESRRSSENTKGSKRHSTQSELSTSHGGVLDEELAKPRSSSSSSSQPSAHSMGNNVEKANRKKAPKAKLLPIRERPRVIPWSEVQWNETAAMWQVALGQDLPDMDYTGARIKPRKVCDCGGKCDAGSSGSSSQDSSSSSSPRSSESRKTNRRKQLISILRRLLRRDVGSKQVQSPSSSPRGSSDSSQNDGSMV